MCRQLSIFSKWKAWPIAVLLLIWILGKGESAGERPFFFFHSFEVPSAENIRSIVERSYENQAQGTGGDFFLSPLAFRLSDDSSPLSPDTLKSPSGAAIRSLVVPGWGQFYNEHYLKGGLIAGVESFLLAATIFEKSRSETEHRERRNTFFIWFLGSLVYSVLDAYVDAHLYGFEHEVQADLAFSGAVEVILRIRL